MKSSFKSQEGWQVTGTLVGGLWILYEHLSGGSTVLPVDKMLALADSAQEIGEIYKAAQQMATSGGLADMGKSGVLLAFMYAVIRKFMDSRTQLKLKEMEAGKE